LRFNFKDIEPKTLVIEQIDNMLSKFKVESRRTLLIENGILIISISYSISYKLTNFSGVKLIDYCDWQLLSLMPERK